jgi:hypothetical protein
MDFDNIFTDPTVKTFAVCNADCALSESLKEKFEFVYVKMVEMTNVMIAKGADPDPYKMKVVVSKLLGSIFDNYGVLGPYKAPGHVEPDRVCLGWVGQRWRVYADENAPTNKIEINTSIGKGILIVDNLEQYL